MAQGRKPDLDGLRRFIGEGDRSPARFFVGRQAQIRDVRDICALARDGNLAGVTRVIQGAPGAGKTAILSRLEELWTGPGDPLLMRCDVADLADPAGLVDAIIEKTASGLADRFRGTFSFGLRGRAGVAGVVEVEGEAGGTAPQAGAPWKRLLRRRPPKEWKRPLCLLVDEIQELERDEADVLRSLHLGTYGFPIVPVLAGLAHSKAVLGRCGISRLSDDAVQTLGALEAGEPSEAVRLMLDRFDIDTTGTDADRWARQIEERSDRWPQHLQNGMRSLAEGLIEANGVLAQVNADAVKTRDRQRRMRACRARRSREIESSRFLVAGIMTGLGRDGRPRGEVIDLVRKVARPDDVTDWQLPSDMNAENFVDHLIARGALQLNDEDLLACPIPSFRRFLIDCGRQTPQQAPSPETPPQP